MRGARSHMQVTLCAEVGVLQIQVNVRSPRLGTARARPMPYPGAGSSTDA